MGFNSGFKGLNQSYVDHDVHESVYRCTITNRTNKMQLYRLIYFSFSALLVSGGIFAHN